MFSSRRFALALTTLIACTEEPTQPSSPATTFAGTVTTTSTDTVVLIGAGDIAGCGALTHDEQTARVIQRVIVTSRYPVRVYTAGDNAYPDGTASDFLHCYTPSWGAFKDRTWFSIGNHEVHADTAGKGYYDYVLGAGADSGAMGKRGRGYHTHEFGAWALYFLNTERNLDAQTRWLQTELNGHPHRCQLFVFHRPLHSTGGDDQAGWPKIQPWHMVAWRQSVDVILAGHSHYYRRTGLIRPDTGSADKTAAVLDTTGYRQFVEGGGGHGSLSLFGPRLGYDQKRIRSWGVLKLTLAPTSYRWERLDTLGGVADSGTQACH